MSSSWLNVSTPMSMIAFPQVQCTVYLNIIMIIITCIYICLCHIRVAYIVNKFVSSQGLGQLMSMAHKSMNMHLNYLLVY